MPAQSKDPIQSQLVKLAKKKEKTIPNVYLVPKDENTHF